MKLNNKGFAISSIMYIILVLAVILISLTLALLSSRKLVLDKLKNEVLDDIYTKDITLVQHINDLYNPTTTSLEVDGITYSLDETNGLMNDRLGSADVGEYGGNIRYYGANPNNYIDIGDRDSSGNIILWRIIGLFKNIDITDADGNVTGTEDLVKIIRADSIGDYSWDYTSSEEFDNNWSDATLKTMLNGAYYNSETTIYYSYLYDNPPIENSVDFTSIGLSESARDKIESVKWNLGGYSTSEDVYANDWYGYERATGISTWSGKVALMYPSDYGYAADLNQCNSDTYNYSSTECQETDWLLDSSAIQWTLTPISGNSTHAINVYSSGCVYSYNIVSNAFVVRPVLYLKSDIAITGEGTTESGINYYVVK